ncbi:PIN domain-containing protein [Streptosporangium sp. NBC_01756]|uniref:PIN domain-containing protein n=1 Tax=Streptosporangium sp. NBC_01756 TaxID=2975950 RepID=UPI002DDB74F8|nr:PIN domain-containing protein [Streptosporangium sp. NBC_01756]WSC83074.1 PIN domain-containing protein [Streptosporangium sp. NBC_01756]
MTAIVREAQDNDFRVVVSAMTPIEAQDVRVKSDRLRGYLSRLRIEPVTEEICSRAIELLRGSRLHGHKYAIDAVVAATALRAVKPVLILTSDEDDMSKLCGKTVKIVGFEGHLAVHDGRHQRQAR